MCLTVAACGLEPGKDRIFDADKEFDKLDSPDVPTLSESLERNALDALAAGEYERASGLYQQLYDKDSNEVRYQLGLAESLRRQGDINPSLEYYDKIIAKHPGHLDAYEGKGLALMARGDTEDAGKVFKSILERDPKRWRTLNALGILFAVKSMEPEALAYFKEALNQSDNNPSVLNNIGLVQAMQHQYRQSVETLQKASKRAEGEHRKQVDLNLALVHGIFGNSDEAKDLASKYLSDAELDNNLGLYAHLANDRELAKSYLNMALSGSTVFYERAWKNLDMIAKEGKDTKGMGKSYKIK